MMADIDPGSGMFDVNLQMVYVPLINHTDSIVFHLDEAFSIGSLSAQELVRYELNEGGRLVLYIQDPVAAGDQVHVSMSYSGRTECKLSPGEDSLIIDSALNWFPISDDIPLMTYRLRIGFSESYHMDGENVGGKSNKTYLLESLEPESSIRFFILRDTV